MNAIEEDEKKEELRKMREWFAERALLAKMTLRQALAQTRQEWHLIQEWVASDSNAKASFNWYCEFFDMEPSAVRRAIETRAK